MLTLTLTVGTYLLGLALIMFVVMQRKDPTATLAWILIIVTLPIVGAILYIWFGIARMEKRVYRRERSDEEIAAELQQFEGERPGGKDRKNIPISFESPIQAAIAQVTKKGCPFPVVGGNAFTLLSEPDTVFLQIGEAIRSAAHSIHMEYYIFRNDDTGRHIRALLTEAAERGVKVRLLVDGIGSWKLPRTFGRPLRKAGGQFAIYVPITPIGRPWHWNYRNHRKIAVIDGRTGMIGSANICDECRLRRGISRDYHDVQILCEGPIVSQLQEVFASDWYFATGESIAEERYFPPLGQEGKSFGQVITCGPDDNRHTFHEMICTAVHGAKNDVRIVTPYFVPDQALIIALRSAALHGARVVIMTSRSTPTPFEHLLPYAARSYYDDLLPYGIAIYEYLPGFLHAKSATVDGMWGTVGTTNMNQRSFRLNFEVNVNLYSKDSVATLNGQFDEHLAQCERIDPEAFRKRGVGRRCLENAVRMFSPIL